MCLCCRMNQHDTTENGAKKSNKVLDELTGKGIPTTHGWTSLWEKGRDVFIWDRRKKILGCHGNGRQFSFGDLEELVCIYYLTFSVLHHPLKVFDLKEFLKVKSFLSSFLR